MRVGEWSDERARSGALECLIQANRWDQER
jgi:hypothetical protein